jgi:transcriptional regulatory protein RtcR
MDNKKKQIVVGLLGTTLDSGRDAGRWERWRPSVCLSQHEDLLINRFELLYQQKYTKLCSQVADDIRSISPETEVVPRQIEFDDPWDFEDVYGALHDFARSYPFDAESEDYLVHITTGTHVAQICLFLLTESRRLPARLLQTSPPKRGNSGPGEYRIIDLDLSKYDRLAARFEREQVEGLSFLKDGIDTRNADFNALMEQIERVALATHDPILLTGPTGAGKSKLARRIYELKKSRKQVEGAFVEVNCATLRGDAAMSTLFGHVKGAFTGALHDRPGLLKAADGGLLFLDEVGELGADEQAMLLRAVEEKAFRPLGSDCETRSDFHLLAGSNRDLAAEAAAGAFRPDLLARIDLWSFRLPGLRDRPEDIEPNVRYELDRFARRTGRTAAFNREAMDKFLAFARSPEALWSANFRDLGAAITRMATLSGAGRITPALVDEEIMRLRESWQQTGRPVQDLVVDTVGAERAASIDRFDRVQLADALEVLQRSHSLSDAGRTLFAASRAVRAQTNDADRLRKYLARFDIDWRSVLVDKE